MVDVIEYAKNMHVEIDIKPRADAYCEIHVIDRKHDFHEVKVVSNLEVRGMVSSQIDEYMHSILDKMTASFGSDKAVLYSQRLRREEEREAWRQFWHDSTDMF